MHGDTKILLWVAFVCALAISNYLGRLSAADDMREVLSRAALPDHCKEAITDAALDDSQKLPPR